MLIGRLNSRQLIMLVMISFTGLFIGLIYHFPGPLNQHQQRLDHDWLLQLLKYNRTSEATLGNFTNFRFVINSDVCHGESDLYMLILVGSRPSHSELRKVLRTTLARPGIAGHTFKMVFLFGHLKDEAGQLRLEEESRRHGDIVQGNFVDSYHNVTLRDLMGLRWAWQYCGMTRYVTRMDDDIALDMYTLVNVLKRCCSTLPVFMGCYVIWHNAPVSREGRYAVTLEEYPRGVYDDYCAGWMYVVTPLMAYLLDWATNNVHYYWMNDAYITGSLVKVLGLKHVQLDIEYTDDVRLMKDMLKTPYNRNYTLGPTGADYNLTRALLHRYKATAGT